MLPGVLLQRTLVYRSRGDCAVLARLFRRTLCVHIAGSCVVRLNKLPQNDGRLRCIIPLRFSLKLQV